MKRLLFTLLFLLFVSPANAAELLVKWANATTYDIGDVVVVQENGYAWGIQEDPITAPERHFIIVEIPGVPVADVLMYLETQYDLEDNIIYKRKYKLDTLKLNKPTLNAINNGDGHIEITIGQWNSFVSNKGEE